MVRDRIGLCGTISPSVRDPLPVDAIAGYASGPPIAQQIVDQGGDYALALKGNKGTLHDDVRTYLDDPATR
jgi:hypothetical protein